ncbi:hypothetical protein [Paenibacillus pinihumi]|uniref:hypothetical protein n=1 Tax=Paenibacillus pinihumi TaxID=669462 RepID=UPI0003F61452|nr:hypothetical protein [Paenibacillus pinihumi]
MSTYPLLAYAQTGIDITELGVARLADVFEASKLQAEKLSESIWIVLGFMTGKSGTSLAREQS